MTILLIALLIGAFSLRISIQPILYARIVAISFLLSASLTFNVLAYQPLSEGVGIFSGLFHVSTVSLSTEFILYLTASFILIPWFISPSLSIANARGKSSFTEDKPLAPGRKISNSLLLEKISGPICSEYSLVLLFSVLGGTLLISSSDLISMYLSIELQSFAVYILATLHKNNESAVSSGLKYFLLGGLSSCFILLGAGLIYSFTGLTNIDAIFSLILSSGYVNDLTLISSLGQDISVSLPQSGESTFIPVLGLLFIVIGFLFKIAAAPLHNWAPDVYDGVPSIVTTWLTIMPKLSIVIFLLKLVVVTAVGSSFFSTEIVDVYPVSEGIIAPSWNLPLKSILLVSSLLSLILGSIVGLAQFKVKRLLAYSTISHVGFLLLALSVNSESSTESLIFYLIQYTFSNLNVFLILLAFGYILKSLPKYTSTLRTDIDVSKLDIRYIYELKGQFVQNPLLSLSLSFMLFSMAGVPPLIGFFAKQQVLLAATHNGYYFMSIIAILVSVISAYYYLQIIKVMHFTTDVSLTNSSQAIEKMNSVVSEDIASSPVTNSHSFIISTLTLGILLFILNPNILLNSVHLLALTLFSV